MSIVLISRIKSQSFVDTSWFDISLLLLNCCFHLNICSLQITLHRLLLTFYLHLNFCISTTVIECLVLKLCFDSFFAAPRFVINFVFHLTLKLSICANIRCVDSFYICKLCSENVLILCWHAHNICTYTFINSVVIHWCLSIIFETNYDVLES